MNFAAALFGSSPAATIGEKFKLAFLRGSRTFLQGVAAALAAGGAGAEILSTGYWETVGVAILGAAITGLVSFLQNVAAFLPDDPTQKAPSPNPTPPGPPNP
jgi:hypothetical protein